MEEINMNKMKRFMSGAEVILKALKYRSFRDNNNPQSESLLMELRLLRTFVVYASNWDGTSSCAAKVVPRLASLLLDIQAVFTRRMRDIEDALTQRRDVVITKLQEKISLLRPQVKAAYERLIIIISSHKHNRTNHKYSIWMEPLRQNLEYLGHISPVKTHLCAICGMLGNLDYFLQSHPSEYTFLSTHFEALLVRAAHICYTCWANITITNDYESITATIQEFTQKRSGLLLHLLNEFKANTPQDIQVCLKLLNKSSSSSSSSSSQPSGSREGTFLFWAEDFIKFLIPKQNGVEILCYGLINLLLFLNRGPHLYKDDAAYVKLVSMDITSALGELGCFFTSFHVNRNNPALANLLVKIELLKLEVFLMNQLNLKANYRRKLLEFKANDRSNLLELD